MGSSHQGGAFYALPVIILLHSWPFWWRPWRWMECGDLGIFDQVGVAAFLTGPDISCSAILDSNENNVPANDIIMQMPTVGSDVDLMRWNCQQRWKEHLAKAHKSQAVDKEMPVASNTTPSSHVDLIPLLLMILQILMARSPQQPLQMILLILWTSTLQWKPPLVQTPREWFVADPLHMYSDFCSILNVLGFAFGLPLGLVRFAFGLDLDFTWTCRFAFRLVAFDFWLVDHALYQLSHSVKAY